MSTTLHYLYDPFCGWCYGAAPLVAAARDVITVRAHGGGMLTGGNRITISPRFRSFAETHDRQIAQVSGQPFGERYAQGLLYDTSAVLDSAVPIGAVLAAEHSASRGLDLLARLQVAHYVEGQRIADHAVLIALAAEVGLEPRSFASALAHATGDLTKRHIADSRSFLAHLGGQGFPTFALEQDGQFRLIDWSAYLGRPQDWRTWLQTQVRTTAPAAPVFGCSSDGCAI